MPRPPRKASAWPRRSRRRVVRVPGRAIAGRDRRHGFRFKAINGRHVDHPNSVRVPRRLFAVMRPTALDSSQILVGYLSDHPSRHAQDDATRRDFLTLDHHRAGTDDRMATDFRAGQNHAADPDQAFIFHHRPVHDGSVTDGHTSADQARIPRIGMQTAQILDVRLISHADDIAVAPQHAAEPHAGACSQFCMPDNCC
ncbi:MAG: hypothetical protein KatS3mg111_0587 [Pirellulaceae bacterium]|nr:MAG: hypothetical protein KatS3mg111_0587 [Pirellulaceae bacterium]